jgi:hypothetical protein
METGWHRPRDDRLDTSRSKAWSNTENVYNDDNNDAVSAATVQGELTDTHRWDDFRFGNVIPVGAIIDEVHIKFEMHSDIFDGSNVATVVMALWDGTSESPTTLSQDLDTTLATYQDTSKGLWGITLTREQVASANFGINLYAVNNTADQTNLTNINTIKVKMLWSYPDLGSDVEHGHSIGNATLTQDYAALAVDSLAHFERIPGTEPSINLINANEDFSTADNWILTEDVSINLGTNRVEMPATSGSDQTCWQVVMAADGPPGEIQDAIITFDVASIAGGSGVRGIAGSGVGSYVTTPGVHVQRVTPAGGFFFVIGVQGHQDTVAEIASIEIRAADSAIALTQAHVLLADDLTHIQDLEAIALRQDQVIGGQGLTHAQLLATTGLSQGYALTIQAIVHAQDLGEAALTQGYVLTAEKLVHLQAVEASALTADAVLSVDDLFHEQGIGVMIFPGDVIERVYIRSTALGLVTIAEMTYAVRFPQDD